ncbi:MAG: hypothetical protein B7Z02_05345 [Rhodobacterales bacterium 32-67-9]|nr:MAG: hypothetical protein B7Z02_05345 [Rhodobacterales bacterium 32-67-9]
MNRGILLLFAPVLFGACASVSRDQCLRAAVEDIRTLDRLIAETEAGRARGYGIVRLDMPVLERRHCTGSSGAATCLETDIVTVERPVAIDPASEDRKLAGMRAKREALIPRAMMQIADCRRRYPEAQ